MIVKLLHECWFEALVGTMYCVVGGCVVCSVVGVVGRHSHVTPGSGGDTACHSTSGHTAALTYKTYHITVITCSYCIA